MRHLLIALTTAATLALSGCGFTPMHATQGGQATFSDVALEVDDGKTEQDRAAGFAFAQHMRARIGDSTAPAYTLSVTPRIQRTGLGLTAQDRATRFDRRFSASWSLKDAGTGKIVARGRSRDTTTFTGDRDPYRLASNDDQSMRRVTRVVADEVLAEVALAIQDARDKP